MRKVCNCLLLALLIQVVASCGNLNVDEPSKVYDSSIKTLPITTGEPSVAKTILPSALDSSSLTYYFTIDDLIYDLKTLQTFDSASSGAILNFPIELPEGYYKIRVFALTASAASGYSDKEKYEKPSSEGGFTADHLAAACVLQGTTTVDLRQDETVSIKLTANNAADDYVSVGVNFYTNGWTLDTGKFNATCGMWNRTGSLVGTMSEVDLNSVTSVEPAIDAPCVYNASVLPGTYTFFVKYTKLSNNSVAYTWTDTIIVSPNQPIKKNIALIDIIEYEPAAPTDFKASYYNVDPTGEFCYVNFTWTDNSVNERGFLIDLLAVQDSVDESYFSTDMAATWNSTYVVADVSKVTGRFTSSGYEINGVATKEFDDVPGLCVDGSLDKNRTNSATFKLSRNIRYLARICAVGYNHAGNSEYCYLDLSSGTGKADYSDFTTTKYFKVGD